jgi:HEAT repeat protein
MAKDEFKKQVAQYFEDIFNKDEGIKTGAIDGLVQIGEPAVPLLINNLKVYTQVTDDKEKRKTVADILVGIGQPAVPYLIKELKSWYKKVRPKVLNILNDIGGPDAEAVVMETSKKWLADEDEEANRVAAGILIKSCKSDIPSLIKLLGEALRNRDSAFSGEIIAEELVKIGEPAVPFLIDVTKNTENHSVLYLAALLILRDIRDPRSIPVFEEAYRSKVSKLCYCAIGAFSNMGEAGAPDLIEIIRYSWDSYYKKTAEEGLLKRTGKAAVPALNKELVSGDDIGWRKKVARLLGQIGDPGAIPALNEVLNDQDKGVRKEAEKALKMCGG